MTLTATEVQQAIEKAYLEKYASYRVRSVSWTDLGGLEIPGLGNVKDVEYVSFGDDDCTGRVMKVYEIGGRFFAMNGMYYSHDGTYWDGPFEEVRKTTKVVTVTEWGTA